MMDKGNLFFLVFIAAILVMRIGVYFFPEIKLKISQTVIHHFFIGILLIFIAVLFFSVGSNIRFILLSIGLGLVADEIVYIILGAGSVSNYWDIYSVSGVAVSAFIVFILRQSIASKI